MEKFLLKAFGDWPLELHKIEEQQERIMRAASAKTTPTSINKKEFTGVFHGSEPEPYQTTLSSCTCPDFQKRQLPCKHIYRLALECGQMKGKYYSDKKVRKDKPIMFGGTPLQTKKGSFIAIVILIVVAIILFASKSPGPGFVLVVAAFIIFIVAYIKNLVRVKRGGHRIPSQQAYEQELPEKAGEQAFKINVTTTIEPSNVTFRDTTKITAPNAKLGDYGYMVNMTAKRIMPPSERQLNYAHKLGIKVPDGACSKDVSALISRIEDDDDDAPAELVEYAESHGVVFSRFAGAKLLRNYIVNSITERERAALFAFVVTHGGRLISNFATAPESERDKCYAFADCALNDRRIATSLAKMTGEWLIHQNDTIAKNAVIDFFY